MKHTRQDLKIMQGWSLERKIRVTQTRIMEWYMRYDGQVFISFSGGKDSTVLLDLARRVYEIPVFHKALSECGSLEVRPVAICVPQEIQEYCMELFGEDVQIAAASHDLFAKQVNGQIYRPLVEKYIAGEKRL